MFDSLSLPVLVLIFTVAAAAVWLAGIQLSNTTEVLASRLGLGEALGGLILLAIATNLPEAAITSSAALHHNLGIATGNILGGIAIQTFVLVILDAFGLGGKYPLTYRAASLTLVLEAVLVIAVLTIAIISTQLPPSLIFARVTPGEVLIAVLWLIGLWLIGKAQTNLPWHERGEEPNINEAKSGAQKLNSEENQALGLPPISDKDVSTARAAIIFTIASVVTLVGGVLLEQSGDAIAQHIGLSGVLFGATILAAATALPEVSTGLAAVKLQDYQLAVSDVFGGNAFLPVLFLLASLLSGEAVLPQATKADIYISGLGILLTTVYIYGLIFRPSRRIFNMGIDSLVVLALYVLGTLGLIAVAQ